jgi:hypothetical protein
MSIDHPHSGANAAVTLQEYAQRFSRQIPGETFMLVETRPGCPTKSFVTNDTMLAHNCAEGISVTYFQNGHHVQEGLELLFGYKVH